MRTGARWSVGATVIVTVLGGLVAGPKLSALAATPQQWLLTPPTRSGVAATVRLDPAGGLTLEARRGATQVLKPSALGIRTTAADLTRGLTFTGRADSHITQTYSTASGRRRQHTVDASQTTLHFTKGGAVIAIAGPAPMIAAMAGPAPMIGTTSRKLLPQARAVATTCRKLCRSIRGTGRPRSSR